MTCHEIRDQLQETLDRPLGSEAHLAIRAHVSGCADCRAYQASLSRVDLALRGLAPVSAPAALVERLGLAEPTRRPSPARWQWAAVAAAVLVLVGVRLGPAAMPGPGAERLTASSAHEDDALLSFFDAEPPAGPRLLEVFTAD